MALVLLTCACGQTGAAGRSGDDGLTIAATTTVMGDVVRNVSPGTAEISVLMEPGTDPHTFEPSARQLAELQDADLVVANGGGLEEGLQAALDDAAAASVPVFSALEHVTPLEVEHEDGDDHDATGGQDARSDHDQERPSDGSGEAQGDATHDRGADEVSTPDGDGHDHGGVDPHFWMDPVRMAEAVSALGTQIGELTGAPQRSAERAQRYATELHDLDRRIVALFDDLPQDRRTIVTNHETLAYFADRYDLRVAGTVIPGMTTGAEPSARDIEQLAAALRREGVTTIFTDSTAPAQLATTLAREVGAHVEIVELHTESLGGQEGGPQSYVDMLMIDAERISGALRP
ncbi:MAG TPA: metal ABC transporter substrate-binding protein [Euzebyales bacterium]|nr:metal ABC transporter substrate-binding protein [Euzebyales bacterium]